MFAASVQPTLVSLFSSTGSDPLGLFSTHADASLPSDSFICILNDATSQPPPSPPRVLVGSQQGSEDVSPDYTLCQTVLHIQSPTLRTTFIRCPPLQATNADRVRSGGLKQDLGLKHPWMHIQVRNMHKEWAFEVGIVDQSGREGIVRCATFQRTLGMRVTAVVKRSGSCVENTSLRSYARIDGNRIPIMQGDTRFLGYSSTTRVTVELVRELLYLLREPKLKLGSRPILLLPLSFPPPSSRPLTAWCTITLNLPSLLPHFSSATLTRSTDDESTSPSLRTGQSPVAQVPSGIYSHVSYVKVYATCRLRRIWFSEGGPQQRLPWEFELYGWMSAMSLKRDLRARTRLPQYLRCFNLSSATIFSSSIAMSETRSPRVNKALMANFKGQTVRLIAKLKSFRDDVAIVEASDGGEVEVRVLKDYQGDSPYVEIIGQVADERTIKMKGFIPLGDSVDMKLADDVVQVWHDPKFVSVF
ncbi:hypothetical protein NUW54_g3618 [Trametes sanguinea]|uniref:Uncharacterized protein n=1 Tax=Trametes sanguinea TaxID=158606 RepID=A0ACC1Q0S5_9APHY|nr:hypothetical protein NUW54_g3618 [Trametes sanguinea]